MFLKNQVLEVSGIQTPQTSSFVEVYLCRVSGNGMSKN